MIRKDKKRSARPPGEENGRSARYCRQADRGYLQKEVPGYEAVHAERTRSILRGIIEQGDVLLIEGNNRISGIIKYSRSRPVACGAFCRPDRRRGGAQRERHVLIEANIGEGVTSAPLSKYFPTHTAVPGRSACRSKTAPRCADMPSTDRLRYDTKNNPRFDALPVSAADPQRWRRRMIAFGSGIPPRSSAWR